MSKEWIALCLGIIVGGLFGSALWMMMPTSNKANDVTLYYHQIGIYQDQSNANNALSQLDSIGIEGYTLNKEGNSIIVCGFSFTKEESEAFESTLKGAGMPILEKEVMVAMTYKTMLEQGEVDELLKELERR